jgi:hypothetical protein
MNHIENILHIASTNAGTMRPLRMEEIKQNLPYIKVQRNTTSRKYEVQGYNYETHDNAPRMPFMQYYLQYVILPNVRGDVSGCYNIELHDSYTYLKNDKDYNNVFTFSKFKGHKGPCLLPDPYMIGDWNGAMRTVVDPMRWEDKMDKCCFFGTTTGDRNPVHNERVQMCIWSTKQADLCNFKITHVAQMAEQDIVGAIGQEMWSKIYHPSRVSIPDQLRYKYHLILDGNTCRYDVWGYKTNTLMLKQKSRDMLWYYPLLHDKTHFVEVDQDSIVNKMNYYSSNPHVATHIIHSANQFSSLYFNQVSCNLYTTQLFEEIANNK